MRLGVCVGGNLGTTGTQGWTGGSGQGCLGLLCSQSQATDLLSSDSPSSRLPSLSRGPGSRVGCRVRLSVWGRGRGWEGFHKGQRRATSQENHALVPLMSAEK